VLARARELGVDEADATERLERLAALDVVDLADDRVYPDDNFSRY
jgi:Mn-dependent DtxR family transcriptional regulator